ncbi:MAG: Rho guanine nucleotide exchange factor 28 [Cirrosporium novae-zelandiae]|nr:MAG: Rho guanine nucleotide exchange factor 28 [Cirrosporium novae-zelandiae]
MSGHTFSGSNCSNIQNSLDLRTLFLSNHVFHDDSDMHFHHAAARTDKSKMSIANSIVNRNFLDVTMFRNEYANRNGGIFPVIEQYQLYLFERILLCCKDVNANKQKNKMLGKDKPMLAKNGKPRLQLKGRIFIQNVTDVVTMKKSALTNMARSGDYTMRIYWKGDPGVENFVIRFINDEQLNKWEIAFNEQRDKAIQNQRAHSVSNGTSTTEFTYMKTQSGELKNPYLQAENDDDDDDDDDLLPPQINGYAKEGQSEFSMSRNASNNSLRSRSATSGSGTSSSTSTVRMPPPSRFPYPDQMPSLHTNIPQNAAVSPGERGGDSYFSPTLESPISTRSSSQSGMFPFPRQPPPPNGWSNEDMNRYTAPATSRNPSREGPNGHSVNGRPSVQRPSLPAMSASQSSQQVMMMQSRMRSASTPDIHSGNPGAPRRYANGQPPIDNVPVPPIPAHMASMRAPLNRSQTNSPAPHGMPMRGMNQSPGAQSHRAPHPGSNSRGPPPHGPMEDGHTRHHWNGSSGQLPDGVPAVSRGQDYEQHQAHSAPLQSPPPSLQDLMPSQLKARILVGENYVTLIIPTNIGFQTLIDRIDAKLSRSSLGSITANSLRIRYRDVDGDLVTIDNDEAIQDAIMDWRDQNKEKLQAGDFRVIGDIDLFCQLFDVPKDDSKM